MGNGKVRDGASEDTVSLTHLIEENKRQDLLYFKCIYNYVYV